MKLDRQVVVAEIEAVRQRDKAMLTRQDGRTAQGSGERA
jgi:hypothetical protein